MFTFKLNDTVSAASPANESDVLTMKSALKSLGEYETPSYGLTPYTDEPMFEGMKTIQKRAGLVVDGIAKPGGPTELTLNAGLARKTLDERKKAASQTTRGTGPKASGTEIGAISKRVQDRREKWVAATGNDVSAFGGQTKTQKPKQASHPASTTLRLTSGVGQNQTNTQSDVIGLKNALSWTGHYPADKARKADPTHDEDLHWGLIDFQRAFNLRQDGYALPGGETETRVNDIVEPLIQLASLDTGGLVLDAQVSNESPRTLESDDEDSRLLGGVEDDRPAVPAPSEEHTQVAQSGPMSSVSGTGKGTSSVPPSLAGIDLSFIHSQEGYELDGYVPKDGSGNVIQNSGVTIGAGVDLGQMNANDLNRLVTRYGLDPTTAIKLTPYLGKTKGAAVAALATTPITLSPAEAEQLTNAKYAEIAENLASKYNAAMSAAGKTDTFATLDPKMKTVALSVAIQYGANLTTETPAFWGHLLSGNSAHMISELRNFRDKFANRRNLEADYLRGKTP